MAYVRHGKVSAVFGLSSTSSYERESCANTVEPLATTVVTPCRWKPPHLNGYAELRRFFHGDSTGDVLFAATGTVLHQSAALQAEAAALMKAINLAKGFGMGRAG